MAVFGNGYRTRAEFPSAMSLLAFARLYRKRPMRHTHQAGSNRQDHMPWTSLDQTGNGAW
jgi:hypothetical protein